jgi:tartrate dehydratase beta subunit/fumarate hydratase class I family protein
VEAKGYAPFDEDVDVRFQKVSQVVVRLLPSTVVIGTGKVVHEERSPFYTKTWFIVSVGVAAVLVGAAIGHEAGHVKTCTIDMGKTTCN